MDIEELLILIWVLLLQLGSYWTYEICHGSHVRQYHEDREMKTPKGQDYSLGKWDPVAVEKLSK